MDKNDQEKPKYFEPLKVIQGPTGYMEVYKNLIGFGGGEWEPTEKRDLTILPMRQKSRSIIDTSGV